MMDYHWGIEECPDMSPGSLGGEILQKPGGYSQGDNGQGHRGFRNPGFICPEAVWSDGCAPAPWSLLGLDPHLATSAV